MVKELFIDTHICILYKYLRPIKKINTPLMTENLKSPDSTILRDSLDTTFGCFYLVGRDS